jgi:hypothetical protein
MAPLCHSGAAQRAEPGIHSHKTQFGARCGGNHVQHQHQWLWIPGPRSARPGMTVVGQFLSADASPHPDPLPAGGEREKGSSHDGAIHGHIATDNRWRYLSPQLGERSDCEAIRVRGKAHRGIHKHGIAFWDAMWRRSCSTAAPPSFRGAPLGASPESIATEFVWGTMGRESCSRSAVGVMDSGPALRASRNDDGGVLAACAPQHDDGGNPRSDSIPHSRDTLRPSFAINMLPPRSEGAGKAGRTMHPQPRVRRMEGTRV